MIVGIRKKNYIDQIFGHNLFLFPISFKFIQLIY